MQKLDYWLIYRRGSVEWHVFADVGGNLIPFSGLGPADDQGKHLVEKGIAEVFSVLHAPTTWAFI